MSKLNRILDGILHGAVGFHTVTLGLSLHSNWVAHSFYQNSSPRDPDGYCHSPWDTFCFGFITCTNDESVIEHRRRFRNYEQSINLWGLISQSKECNTTPNLIENSLHKGQLMRNEQFGVSGGMKWWNLRVYQRFKHWIWLSPVTGGKSLSHTDLCSILYSVVPFGKKGLTFPTCALSPPLPAYTHVSGKTTRLLKPLELMPWRKLGFASWLLELTMSLLLFYNSPGLMSSISYQKGCIWPLLWKYLGRNKT